MLGQGKGVERLQNSGVWGMGGRLDLQGWREGVGDPIAGLSDPSGPSLFSEFLLRPLGMAF